MEEHRHTFSPEEWPFDDPTNVGAFATRSFMERREPVLFVAHDEMEGEWEFHRDVEIPDGELKYVCLGCIFERDRTIAEVADLPYGREASRTEVGGVWPRPRQSARLLNSIVRWHRNGTERI